MLSLNADQLTIIESTRRKESLGGYGAKYFEDGNFLILLGSIESDEERGYSAHAQIWSLGEGAPSLLHGITDPDASLFNTGAFVTPDAVAVAGLPGRLHIVNFATGEARGVGLGIQGLTTAIEPIGEHNFAVASVEGGIQLWTVDGARLVPDIARPPVSGISGVSPIARDSANEELFFIAGDHEIRRTILSGPRLKRAACAQIFAVNEKAMARPEACDAVEPTSPWLRRIRPMRNFIPYAE